MENRYINGYNEKRMRIEARKRIKIMEDFALWKDVGEAWEEGKTCYTKTAVINIFFQEELVGVTFTFDENAQFKAIKEAFEKGTKYLVYYGIYTKTNMGNTLSLLYVSTDEEEWEKERRDLKNGSPIAYCYNFRTKFGEIGSISITMARGGGIRIIK